MKTYRNLSYALLILTIASMVTVMTLSTDEWRRLHMAFYNVSVSVFSVALVVLIVSLFMYFQSKNAGIVVLKRRGTRVYGELLQHKMKLIEVMDGEKPLAEWENFLYNRDEFPRIKKFLYEEYYLLLSYEPFIQTKAAETVQEFHDWHKLLETFIRSVMYDRFEYQKFRREYHKELGHDLSMETREEDFSPKLAEAYEALLSANEHALGTVDSLLKTIDGQLSELDRWFRAGVPWSETKPGFEAEFRMWMGAKD